MTKKTKILLAEDDENLGRLLHTFLVNKGFDAVLAENGKIAFRIFGEGGIDFCIFDVMMPEMDGFTLAKEIPEDWSWISATGGEQLRVLSMVATVSDDLKRMWLNRVGEVE